MQLSKEIGLKLCGRSTSLPGFRMATVIALLNLLGIDPLSKILKKRRTSHFFTVLRRCIKNSGWRLSTPGALQGSVCFRASSSSGNLRGAEKFESFRHRALRDISSRFILAVKFSLLKLLYTMWSCGYLNAKADLKSIQNTNQTFLSRLVFN